jgi:hypothetical protein
MHVQLDVKSVSPAPFCLFFLPTLNGSLLVKRNNDKKRNLYLKEVFFVMSLCVFI